MGWGGVSAYSRKGAYSRWALIRGWALMQINAGSVNVPPGHQGERKKSESSICVWKTLLLSLTSKIVFSKINRISLNC